jgi:hypothetical protein
MGALEKWFLASMSNDFPSSLPRENREQLFYADEAFLRMTLKLTGRLTARAICKGTKDASLGFLVRRLNVT